MVFPLLAETGSTKSVPLVVSLPPWSVFVRRLSQLLLALVTPPPRLSSRLTYLGALSVGARSSSALPGSAPPVSTRKCSVPSTSISPSAGLVDAPTAAVVVVRVCGPMTKKMKERMVKKVRQQASVCVRCAGRFLSNCVWPGHIQKVTPNSLRRS